MRAAVGVLAFCACLPEAPPSPDEGRTACTRAPMGVVPVDGPVLISCPNGLAWKALPTVTVSETLLRVQFASEATGLALAPLPRWPPSREVRVNLEGCLEGPDGEVEADPVVFVVAALREDQRPTLDDAPIVRRPVPGRLAPSNLAWLSVAGISKRAAATLRLRSEAQDEVSGVATAEGATARPFRLEGGTECERLCPGRVYRVIEPSGAQEGPVGEVRTGTVADLRPPRFLELRPIFSPGRASVEAVASEAVRAGGSWSTGDRQGHLISQKEPGRWLQLVASPVPPEAGTVALTIVIEDMAGNTTSTLAEGVMPIQPEIKITELVPTPRRDWGDSEPMGEPFDAWPGSGTVSSSDEWVELVNRGSRALDIRELELELRALDGSPAVTAVVSAPALRFGDGGDVDSWAPGEALVVRTRGDMAQRDLRLELWAGAVRLDRVVLANQPDADHPGGAPPDLVHEAVAIDRDGIFRWCEATPGDPTPSALCRRD